jgi:hypothetical protein
VTEPWHWLSAFRAMGCVVSLTISVGRQPLVAVIFSRKPNSRVCQKSRSRMRVSVYFGCWGLAIMGLSSLPQCQCIVNLNNFIVIAFYSKTGVKHGNHGSIRELTNISAVSYIDLQLFKFMHGRRFQGICGSIRNDVSTSNVPTTIRNYLRKF